jgi:hypothetical protein
MYLAEIIACALICIVAFRTDIFGASVGDTEPFVREGLGRSMPVHIPLQAVVFSSVDDEFPVRIERGELHLAVLIWTHEG